MQDTELRNAIGLLTSALKLCSVRALTADTIADYVTKPPPAKRSRFGPRAELRLGHRLARIIEF